MNTNYCVVWNSTTNTWVVASELATGRKKSGKSATTVSTGAVATVVLGAALALTLAPTSAQASDDAGKCTWSDQKSALAIGAGDTIFLGSNCDTFDNVGALGGVSRSIITKADGFGTTAGGAGANAGHTGYWGGLPYAGTSVSGSRDFGNYATSFGAYSGAYSEASTAIGAAAITHGVASTALGFATVTDGNSALAIGDTTKAKGYAATAIGAMAQATSDNAIAMGTKANVGDNANGAIALGSNGYAVDSTTGHPVFGSGLTFKTVDGAIVRAGALNGMAMGAGSVVGTDAADGIAIGESALVDDGSYSATALGAQAKVGKSAMRSTALGQGATVNDNITDAVALGSGSIADASNTVSVGSAGKERKITHVAAGTADTDAVNVKQLKATGLLDSNGDAASVVVYDNAAKNAITLGGVGAATPVAVRNVAAGAVTATSTDAVNGAQLYGTANSIAGIIGGGSTVNSDGTISAPTYTMGDGSTTHSVGEAVGNLDARTTQNTSDIASINTTVNNIANGTTGLVQQDATSKAITVAKDTGGTVMNVAGTDGDRTVTGVKAGVADSDAVNVKQLKDAGLINADGSTANAVSYDNAIKSAVTLGGLNAASPVALHNVADGSADKDAVNAGQLRALGINIPGQDGTGGTNGTNGKDGVTLGNGSNAGGDGSVAIGKDANSGGDQSVAVGPGANSSGDHGVAVGPGADASGDHSVATGPGAIASGDHSVANGSDAKATGDHSVAVGGDSNASGNGSTAVGDHSSATGDFSSAFGKDANASGNGSTALGAGSTASGTDSTALGKNAHATADNSVALGADSVADRANSVSVGSAGHERQITNVARGTAPTDAVNVQQLNDAWSMADQKINDVNKQAHRGIAASAALINVTPYIPGHTTVNAGIASYHGEAALGVGVSRWSENGRLNLNAGVSAAHEDEPILRVGVGYVF